MSKEKTVSMILNLPAKLNWIIKDEIVRLAREEGIKAKMEEVVINLIKKGLQK